MDMTTIARVKVHVESKGQKIKHDSDVDDLLTVLIADYSASFERYLGRQVLVGATTEYFDVEPGQRVFFLVGYPVGSVTSVYHDTSRVWTSGEIASTAYYLDTSTGYLNIDGAGLFPGPGVLRVIYSGGMAANAAAFIVAFPDISHALDIQVAYHYSRTTSLGATSVSGRDGSVTNEGALNLLPTVRAALNGHRRLIVG